MSYDRLIKTGKIRSYTAQPSEVLQLLQVAKRDIHTAERNLEDAPDWAYSIAYNSVLQASRALMLSEGYRPRGADQHATVVEFIEERFRSEPSSMVHLFDQMRRKRHRVIYESAGLVSKTEAEQAIGFAKKFIVSINNIISIPGKTEI